MEDQIATITPSPAENQAVFNIQRTYLKGISLELPKGAETFLQQGNPNIDLNLGVSSTLLADGVFEVNLRATLTSQIDGKTLFLLEVDQAGIFEIRNIPAEQMQGVLEVSCPGILAPYLRAQIADAQARATLPIFYLPEINWLAMFQQRAAEAQAPAAVTTH
jgi:preprotein translocase subunit SecB